MIALLILLLLHPIRAETTLEVPAQEDAVLDLDQLEKWNGKRIETITISGLVRTNERAIRWLITQKEGDSFDSELWVRGIRKIYNTQAIYDIHTDVKISADGKIAITLSMRDKWTLVPDINLQGSSNATNFQFGIYDNNFLGNFTTINLVYGQFNSLPNYDIDIFQEWLFDTDYMASLDFSQNTIPLLSDSGWTRSLQSITFGRRFYPKIRLFGVLALMQDSGQETISGQQWKLQPTIIFGRSDFSNYLEEGYELTLKTNLVNLLSPQNYNSVLLSYKLTDIILGKSNWALYAALGVTGSNLRSYQFTLGGFDTVRGYSAFRLISHAYSVVNLEFRPLLWSHRFGWEPLDWIVLQGCLFTDWGATLRQGTLSTLSSIGAGLRLNFVKYSGAIVRFDYAQTLAPNEGSGISFGIGQFF